MKTAAVALAWVAIALSAAWADDGPAPSAPPTPGAAPAPAGPSAATLGWPADTSTVEVTTTSHVLDQPHRKARTLGKIVRGTRVTVVSFAAGDRRCKVWVGIAPVGFLCAKAVRPTTAAPGGQVQPVVDDDRAILPGAYFDVGADDTPAYADATAVRAGAPRELLSTHTMVRSRGEVEVDGVDYQQTNKGLVPSSELRRLAGSSFAGLDLRTTPAPWPMAFVQPKHPVIVRATPDKRGAKVDQRDARSVVWVKATQGDWTAIGVDQWVRSSELRYVTLAPPPTGLAADAPWIDVDLDQQTLVAYQGGAPVYVTLVSTGRRKGTTPVGTYRIVAKAATTRMAAEADEASQYDVGEVPWALRWKSGLFLHAAYWHDSFGDKKSHGCVNLSPRDARALYEWATPIAPIGWSELEILVDDAVVVRVRDATHPDPPWFDYAKERPNKKPKAPKLPTAPTP
ncbi:MAG: L,D-transpeptidase [Kofleriaceae bacterium]